MAGAACPSEPPVARKSPPPPGLCKSAEFALWRARSSVRAVLAHGLDDDDLPAKHGKRDGADIASGHATPPDIAGRDTSPADIPWHSGLVQVRPLPHWSSCGGAACHHPLHLELDGPAEHHALDPVQGRAAGLLAVFGPHRTLRLEHLFDIGKDRLSRRAGRPDPLHRASPGGGAWP